MSGGVWVLSPAGACELAAQCSLPIEDEEELLLYILTVSITYFVLSSMVAGGYVFSSGRIGRLVYGG